MSGASSLLRPSCRLSQTELACHGFISQVQRLPQTARSLVLLILDGVDMKLNELRGIVESVIGGSDCKNAQEHCWRLATIVMERQREVDQEIARQISPEAADAIAGA